MLPRLQFGGPAARETFVAEGSRWAQSAWVCMHRVEEDLAPLLSAALEQLPKGTDDRILVTFDFPEVRQDGPGFQAKLWLPAVFQSAESIATEPTPSIATQQRALQPSNARLLESIDQLASVFAGGDLDKVVLAQRLQTEAPSTWRHVARSEGPVWTLGLEENDRSFFAQTPEALLRWSGTHLESMALAGTTSRDPDPETDQGRSEALLASAKDRREHKSVVTHLQKIIGAHCARLSVPEHPHVLQLPRLQHLCTKIEAEQPRLHPLLLAAKLHPTPALCGEPRLDALRHLQAIEGFPRGLYGGVIGWLSHDKGALVVGLRAIQKRGDQLELIAGAGCVPGSNPAQELEEIHLKRASILAEAGLHLA